MATRNERRISKKQNMKHREEFVKNLDPLKRFVFKGLANGTLTKEDLASFAKHFLETEMTLELATLFIKKELLLEMADETAIEFLGNRYTVTKNKTETETEKSGV